MQAATDNKADIAQSQTPIAIQTPLEDFRDQSAQTVKPKRQDETPCLGEIICSALPWMHCT